jgi:hypothetical protein
MKKYLAGAVFAATIAIGSFPVLGSAVIAAVSGTPVEEIGTLAIRMVDLLIS